MKKLNLLRLLFGAMFLIAATAFTSCVDDNDDDGMPYLEVAPEALTFSAEGVAEGASAVTVKSNRPWTLAFESVADWVTPSATDGKAGTTEVEFSIPASNESRDISLIINRLRPDMIARGDMMSVDDVTDILAVDLIGTILDDEQIVIATNQGEPLSGKSSQAEEEYMNICKRLLGEEIPFADINRKQGLLRKIGSFFKK